MENTRKDRNEAPLIKLSVDLIKTYKTINQVHTLPISLKNNLFQVYYTAKKKKQVTASTDQSRNRRVFNDGFDDENADYIIRIGEIFNERSDF